MASNGLVCFQNGALALEDGTLVENELWIDECTGLIVDAQASDFAPTE